MDTTVADLAAAFLSMMDQAVAAGRSAPATRTGYRFQFAHLLRAAGEKRAATLVPEDLAAAPYTYHFAAAVRRLFKWAHESGRVPANRFTAFTGPLKGQRERVLTAAEYRVLMLAAGPALRRVLWFLRHTFARPGEARGLRWSDVCLDESVIRLHKFKARDRRRDGVRVRKIPLVPEVVRAFRYLLWSGRPAGTTVPARPDPAGHVFLNSRGRAWTGGALRLAMYRAADRAGLNAGAGERAVCYTLRHTGATEATRRGVRDRLLAEILGHTTTRTTARYQHLVEADLLTAMAVATRRRGRSA